MKRFIQKATMLHPNNINSDVHLTNSSSHAKFERVLPDIYSDIHRGGGRSIIGRAHIQIFVLCIINFFWNRLFLQSVNTNIWICAPPIIDLPRPLDIHHFIDVIYYWWVDDVKRHLICMFYKPKYLGNETRHEGALVV